MSPLMLTAGIASVIVFAALVAFDSYSSRRRERRILSQTANSVKEARDRADAQLLETRKRNDAYQEHISGLMEEHNALLREILSELKGKNP